MKPRVVIFSAFLTPLRSGAEACAEEVSVRLADRYDIAIVTAKMRRDLPRRDVLKGVPVFRVGFGCTFDKWLYPFLAPFAARKLKPDLVHAVLETFAGMALWMCRFAIPNARRLLTLQTTNTSFLKAAIIRAADGVTAISSVLIAIAKTAGRKATRIPNGIDMHAFDAARHAHKKVPGRILFVGRLEWMKGVETLLQAFATLPQETTLHIVGRGSLRSALERQVRALRLGSRVTFAGYISAEAIAKEYAQAEIFCALSRSEALGNVFLEAQAAGCAVVASNIGGIPDIVLDSKTGLLVPKDDPVVAATALEELLKDAQLRARLSKAAIEHARSFDWDAIAAAYASVYDDLLRSRTTVAAR